MPEMILETPAVPAAVAELAGQAQPDALKALDDKELQALTKALRELKGRESAPAARKALGQALRRTAAEKLSRLSSAQKPSGPRPGRAKREAAGVGDKMANRLHRLEQQAGKLEEKRRKLAEKLQAKATGKGARKQPASTDAGRDKPGAGA